MSEANPTQNPNRLGVISYDLGFLDTAPFMARHHNYEYNALPVATSTTIDDAITFVRDYKPSLLFLEVNWNQSPPDRKGLDALVRINQLENPPAVYMTSGDEIYRQEAIGKGAAGYINLAKDHSDPFSEVLERHKKPISRKRYALVVDDQENLRGFASTYFKRAGFEVTEAKDGLEARAKYESKLNSNNPFDIVLTDLMMSQDQSANGDIIVEAVKTLTPNVPVYVWTSPDTRADYEPTLARVKRLNPNEILEKPSGLRRIMEIIDNTKA